MDPKPRRFNHEPRLPKDACEVCCGDGFVLGEGDDELGVEPPEHVCPVCGGTGKKDVA